MNNKIKLKSDFDWFTNCFVAATEHIGEIYMLLPVANKATSEYRERVYCYELYHHLRLLMGNSDYSLCGEVDKTGHPLIRGNGLDKVKPDLIVHIPGNMGGNLTNIEVKSIRAKRSEIKKDLSNLTAFCKHGNYYRAIYLIYGDSERALARIKKTSLALASEYGSAKIDLELIDLYWHPQNDQPAEKISWF